MNFKNFIQRYAEEIGGEFNDYDDAQSIIVIPLPDERFQAVQGRVFAHPQYQKEVVQIKSKVCPGDEDMNLHAVLEASAGFVHAKFVIEDGFLKVEAASFLDSVTEDQVKEMIQEVGNLADRWEMKITGRDIY